MTLNPTRRVALAAPLLLGAAACSQEIGERPLRGADTHAAGYPTVQAVDHFGELLSERTDGRLRLRNFPGGQLGGEGDALAAKLNEALAAVKADGQYQKAVDAWLKP